MLGLLLAALVEDVPVAIVVVDFDVVEDVAAEVVAGAEVAVVEDDVIEMAVTWLEVVTEAEELVAAPLEDEEVVLEAPEAVELMQDVDPA